MVDDELSRSGQHDLVTSLSNLHRKFGSTEKPLLGLAVNAGLAAIGIVGVLLTSGILEVVAAAWAGLNILGIVKWVIGL